MKFAGKIYSGDLFLGDVCANSFKALKRNASRKCNNHFMPVDTMVLHRANDKEVKEVKFVRVNRICPNNTIIRGCWH